MIKKNNKKSKKLSTSFKTQGKIGIKKHKQSKKELLTRLPNKSKKNLNRGINKKKKSIKKGGMIKYGISEETLEKLGKLQGSSEERISSFLRENSEITKYYNEDDFNNLIDSYSSETYEIGETLNKIQKRFNEFKSCRDIIIELNYQFDQTIIGHIKKYLEELKPDQVINKIYQENFSDLKLNDAAGDTAASSSSAAAPPPPGLLPPPAAVSAATSSSDADAPPPSYVTILKEDFEILFPEGEHGLRLLIRNGIIEQFNHLEALDEGIRVYYLSKQIPNEIIDEKKKRVQILMNSKWDF